MKDRKITKRLKVFLAALLGMVAGMTALQAQPLTGPGIDPNAQLLIDFEDGDIEGWNVGNAGRGEKTSVELMDAEKGDPVRFGRYAIKLNWDFSEAQVSQTLGAYFAPPGDAFVIPAAPNPRKIGMWIYLSPECKGNLWVRFQLFNPPGTTPSNSTVVSVFGNEPAYDGAVPLRWDGWKYHEFEFPAGGANKELGPPGSVTSSYAMIRVMMEMTRNPADGSKLLSGYFIIDNIRVTSVAEDVTPPTVSDIQCNGAALDGKKFSTRDIEMSATFDDDHANSSGINYESIRVIIDGYAYKEGDAGFSVDRGNNAVTLNARISNGQHTATVHVEDNFGNIKTGTATFTVQAEGGTDVAVVPSGEANVGSTVELKLNTNDLSDVKEIDFTFQLNNAANVAATGAVTFAESVTEGSYTYNPSLNIVNVKLKHDPEAATGEGTLATVNIDIPVNTSIGTSLYCTPVLGVVTYADDFFSTFTFDAIDEPIKSDYEFTVLRRVVGLPGEVLVNDISGNPVAGATVHILDSNFDSVESAVTGAEGIATGLAEFTATEKNVYIYVEKDGKYSFTRFVSTLNALLTNVPTNIKAGVAPDPTASKTVVWMSNPLTSTGPALMKLAKKSEGESAFAQHEGEVKYLDYTGTSKGSVKGSTVTVKNLDAGTAYIYQVGDGTAWSDTREFTTATVTDKFSFAAFGDLQATSNDIMGRFIAAAKTVEEQPNHLFNLNVGDIVDSDDRYDMVSYYGHLFNEQVGFSNIDMIGTYGNHEYMGSGENIRFYNAHPSYPQENLGLTGEYDPQLLGVSYASIYGNAVVVGLDWEHRGGSYTAIMTEMARWMDEVFAKNNKTWKIVALHYPIYPSASTPGSQDIFQPIFDRHNVQIVFCGHGHTWRRVQIRDGNTISTGNTSTPQTGGTLHWELGDMTATNANGKWVLCEVEGAKMNITVRDAGNNVVDNESFTFYAAETNFPISFRRVNMLGTLTATVDGRTISSPEDVMIGKNAVFTATPDERCSVKEWRLNGVVIEGFTGNTYTLTGIAAAAEVTVEFETESYPVTFNAVNDEGGTLTASNITEGGAVTSGDRLKYGMEVFFRATPNEGYRILEWKTNSTIDEGITANTRLLTITEATEITVEFAEIPPVTYEITFHAGSNGNIEASVDGTVINTGDQVEEGSSIVFTATPNANYRVLEWMLNNVPVAGNATNSYTLENMTAATDVSVEFEIIPATGNGEMTQANTLKARVSDGLLHIGGLTPGNVLSIYSVSGALIYHNVAAAEEVTVPLKAKGVYMIQSGGSVIKAVIN